MKALMQPKFVLALMLVCGLCAKTIAHAEVADLADVPLANSPSDAVLPNLMYILDDSGSMQWDYMPDNIYTGPGSGGDKRNCKSCSSGSCTTAGAICSDADVNTPSTFGEPPYFASRFNQIYYNPDISYPAAVDSTGTTYGDANPLAAKVDFYSGSATTKNLTTTYPDIYYCTVSGPSAAQLASTVTCRRNGTDNLRPAANNYFLYWSNSTSGVTMPPAAAAGISPLGSFPLSDGAGGNPDFQYRSVQNTGAPYYFNITPHEYCSDANLINCALANADGSAPTGFTIPAPLRYCATTTNAASTAAISDPANTAAPKCRKKFNTSTYIYPRYGRFTRVAIVPATAAYTKSANAVRPDCVGAASCTYAEELQNFANWYQYYRTRMAMMKTATGRAFVPIDDRYRVGFITINPQSAGTIVADRYHELATFVPAQKAAFYSKLYGTGDNGSTPLRQALSRVGRHYAGVTTGINAGMGSDPITHSCQQNFALLTSDGYWNDSGTVAIDTAGSAVNDQDDVPSAAGALQYVSRGTGTLDGLGTNVRTVSVVTETEHNVCSGSSNTTFLNASGVPTNIQQACGCGAGLFRIKQRLRSYTRTVNVLDGIAVTTYSTVSNTFSNITAICAAAPPVISLSPNPTITAAPFAPTTTYGGTANTLADVAMYYYKNDLRTGAPTSKSDNNVPANDKDIASHQHMVTFTLGLGLQGLMDYQSDYESATTGDFAKIKTGSNSCSWTVAGATCNWPAPAASSPTTLDDLWHTAVNGRGVFYSATDPNSLSDGLAGALSALKIQTAAASASATSSPNITETDNFIYSSTFRTVKWDGQIEAQRIDTVSGNVLPTIAWSAQGQLDGRVTASSDDRSIYTFDETAPEVLKPFLWNDLSATEMDYFNNKCIALSQCALLSPAQQSDANDGKLLVPYLRGQTAMESTGVFRDRDHVLGDPVNATPAFIRKPRFGFRDSVTPLYETFKTDNASRQGVLYIAANDGMLHAFNGDTGNEIWAYVPRMVMPDLHQLATDNWDVKHRYFVDGSPQFMDVFDRSVNEWKTILVGGLNSGGRGYYALDVTKPTNPKGMWEICSDKTVCAIFDEDLGFTFGNPVITKRPTDGRWVVLVTSGINNVSPGDGQGYLYELDVFTGAILGKHKTGEGDTTTPSGFSKISAYANNFNVDNTAVYVYGGDLLGNVFRFDMQTDPPTLVRIAQLTDASGKPQPITTRPELGVIDTHRVLFIGTGRYLGEDDLSDPATLSPALPWAYQQSFYAFKDKDWDGATFPYGDIRSGGTLVQQTITDTAGVRTTSNVAVDWNVKDGWFVDFNPGNTSPGERVNLDPVLVLGTLVVATNVPNNNACTVGGDSWVYQFDYKDGSYVASAPGNQVAQKFTGQIIVGIVVVRLPSGVLKAIATGATGTKTAIGVSVGGAATSGRRISWRELFQ